MDSADTQPVPDVPEDYDSAGDVRPSSPEGGSENEGPANPSSEAEDRPKSPPGGRPLGGDGDDDVAVDPEDAPTANSFMTQITVVMLVLVVFVVVTALTESMIMLVLTFLGILAGVGVVLRALFSMMSTD